MGFCHQCGYQLTLGIEKFCPNCGTDLQQQQKTAAIGGRMNNNNNFIGIQHTEGDVFGAGFRGSGNIIGKEVSYTVQGNVYNIINSPPEVQEEFRKINTISTQLDIAQYHGAITTEVDKNIEKKQEVAATRQVAYEFLGEIDRIEKEKGTEIKEIKVGETQISKNELYLKEIILKGNEYYYNKEYKEAIECYDKALEIDPNNTNASVSKGVALHNLGKYDKSIECYDKALEIDPNYADAWYNRACSKVKKGDIDDGLTDLKKAIEIDKEKYVKLAKEDRDFESIRNDDRFKALISDHIQNK
jgi:tetratricopeptide (TPR) repeat protein